MVKAKQSPLSIPLSARLREHREHAGLGQDQLARRAREAGLDWRAATVAAIETGRRELSLEEFFALRGRRAMDDEIADLFVTAAGWGRAFAKVRSEASLDAEIKAARKLGVSPDAVVAASRRLWRRTLTEERDRQLESQQADSTGDRRTVQAHRGHVTRRLLAELGAALQRPTRQGRRGR